MPRGAVPVTTRPREEKVCYIVPSVQFLVAEVLQKCCEKCTSFRSHQVPFMKGCKRQKQCNRKAVLLMWNTGLSALKDLSRVL